MAFLLLLLTPLLALLGAGVAALVLFWPVMLLLGVLHNQVGFEWVPAPLRTLTGSSLLQAKNAMDIALPYQPREHY